ncbi:MAG: hypothetical protein IKD74_05465 [Clostridia bacterium]|nr:hypothetical protein [Clostridia bacterium]
MRKLTKFLSIIMILAMAMTVILPTVITADEVKPVDTNPDVVINMYEGRLKSSFTELENKCMNYLFNMYRLVPIPIGNTGKYAYGTNVNKKLFTYNESPNNPEDYIISIAPDVTSEDNLVVYPDKEFFISVETFGTSEAVPNSITLNFTSAPVGQEVTITITDGMDAEQMSNINNACMTYLFATNILDFKEDDCTIFNKANNKDLMYFENEDSSILRIADGVTSADNIEVTVASEEYGLVEMFQYYGVTEIPTKIKLQFQVEKDILKGDLDGNNVVDANDASVALELFKSQNATAEDVRIGDMDENNLIDANDASLILEYFKTHQ